ncbi:DoxX family membrane protein [Chryseobacterium sp. Alg-005]|uniref:hypothetical protein n=1 Tax=Chryseobacterium sp. Alg-005 TaxID=3159516 RepID=UPI003555A069
METIQLKQFQKVFNILKFTFVVVPVVAGLDKFTNILCEWEKYINPALLDILPFSAAAFMMIVGIIEIIAGVLVLINPKIGGLVVSVWLVLIALTLLAGWNFADVAVRDLVIAVSAFSMTRLASILNSK